MSLFDCIERAIGGGEMPVEPGRRLQELVRRLEAEYAHMGPDAAAAQAAADAKKVFREETLARRRAVLGTIKAQRDIARAMAEYRDITGGPDRSGALPALLEYDQAATFMSVRGVRESLRGRYHRIVADVLVKHQKDMTGAIRNRADLPVLVRELMGENTGNANARELAEAVTRAFETARRDFNAAGGHIGKLQDFGLPHRHDAQRIRRRGFDAWADEIMPRLDWERIPDHRSGRSMTASSQPRRREFLREIYDTITTYGWTKREPSGQRVGQALYNRRADHRVLHFRSADDWLAYDERFGTGDPFTSIMSHLDHMALDTAMMRVLGPNPRAGLEFAIQTLEKAAATDPWAKDAADRVRSRAQIARTMMGHLTGEVNRGGDPFWANFMAGTRNYIVASRLGGAFLSSLGDVQFGGQAARHVGMGVFAPMQRQMRLMASQGARQEALTLGVVADAAADAGVMMQRLLGGEITGPEVTRRLADFTLRMSFLTQWTEVGRHAFQLEMFAQFAAQASKSWDHLDEPFRRLVLQARGFSPADWDAIRATPLHRTPDGGLFLLPDDIRFRDDIDPEYADGLSLRLGAVVQEQTEFAVPSYSLRGRANIVGETRAGSFVGELARSGAAFKGFAVTLFVNNIRRVALADGRDPRWVRIIAFGALTTFAGAVAVNMKEIGKGRDPQDMTTPEFWGRAMAQGGGLGIFGDFIGMSAQNRFGDSFGTTLAGPAVGLANDVGRLTIGNLSQFVQGEDTDFGRDLTRFLRFNAPGANVWWWSQAYQRGVMDYVQRALDPEAEEAWRRAERTRLRDFGNPAYWPPGAPLPRRAPDLSAAAGGS
jgi:hypothetical protein